MSNKPKYNPQPVDPNQPYRIVERLRHAGFDRSEASQIYGMANVKCSQCEALVINGIPAHERGCPNQTFECKGCNNRVKRQNSYCEDCQ